MRQAESIESPANPLLKEIRRSARRGSLTREGYCIAETFRLLEEALRSGCEVGAVLAAEPVRPTLEGLAGRLGGARLVVLPERLFGEIATTESPQGVMALVRPPAWTLAHIFAGRALAVLLDGLQDPGNAGAIVRSAEAFGATGVAFLMGSVCPWNPKAVRASAGSLFRVPVVSGVERPVAIEAGRQNGVSLYAAGVRASLSSQNADLAAPCAIIIGNEGRGLSPEWADAATGIRIATEGVESLNAALAAGILLYEASRQRGA